MNKNIRAFIFYILVSLISNFSYAASSDFINRGTYFTDNIEKLDWLNFSTTYGKTYSEINQAIQDPSSHMYGYRVASFSELITLANNFSGVEGVVFPESHTMLYPTQSLRGLVGLFGNLYSPVDTWGLTYAYVSDYSVEDVHMVFEIFSAPSNPYDFLTNSHGFRNDDSDINIAAFLVRNSIPVSYVPESRSFSLLLSGLMLIGLVFRKETNSL